MDEQQIKHLFGRQYPGMPPTLEPAFRAHISRLEGQDAIDAVVNLSRHHGYVELMEVLRDADRIAGGGPVRLEHFRQATRNRYDIAGLDALRPPRRR